MKNTFYRAIQYLKYKKMKSCMLALLFVIVSGIILLSATLNSTIDKYYKNLDTTNGISVSVSPKMNFNRGSSSGKDIREKFTQLTEEQLESIKKLSYVSDIKQSTTISVTSSKVEEITYSDSSTSSDSNSSSSNGNMQAPEGGGGNRMDMSGLKILGSTHLNLESDFTNSTISLSEGNMPSANDEIMISESLASQNNLKVGSNFTVKNSDESKSKTYKVVGLYKYNETLDEMAMQMVPENTMYTTYDSSQELVTDSTQARTSTQFFIKSSEDLDQFKTDYFKITGTSANDYEVTLNDDVYKNTIEPLAQLESIVSIAKWVVLGLISGILAIISYLMIKERNYEIGVLYSISESKRNIVLQFILENGIILTISFIIALIINKLMGSWLISTLMNMDLFNGVKQGAQQMGGGPGGPGGMNGTSESLTNIDAYINIGGILQSYGFVLLVVVLITILTIARILMKRPKEIISE